MTTKSGHILIHYQTTMKHKIVVGVSCFLFKFILILLVKKLNYFYYKLKTVHYLVYQHLEYPYIRCRGVITPGNVLILCVVIKESEKVALWILSPPPLKGSESLEI